MLCTAIFQLHVYKEGTFDSPGLACGGFLISASATLKRRIVKGRIVSLEIRLRTRDQAINDENEASPNRLNCLGSLHSVSVSLTRLHIRFGVGGT